ncbi:hypothetical protein [Prauserella rugosa]|uniref:Uncharacterized protein n=1 Tax=Prauserella rugosa TaxID=43354 RepID=A0A660C6U7_9PSEU|nr:hypothetical protein [Prauserella rugosa]KMS92659.1 hypothetical protein ACZ91_03060 [Streptomyces regensis]TWH15940.1 hypothetical protein JD82_04928 [Prauserella rugosa]TWH16003.1 hypothetical protein JD82_04991 [Prauserella rugosa]
MITGYRDMINQVRRPSDLREVHARLIGDATVVDDRADFLERAEQLSRLHEIWVESLHLMTAAVQGENLRDTARRIAILVTSSAQPLDAEMFEAHLDNLVMCLDAPERSPEAVAAA